MGQEIDARIIPAKRQGLGRNPIANPIRIMVGTIDASCYVSRVIIALYTGISMAFGRCRAGKKNPR